MFVPYLTATTETNALGELADGANLLTGPGAVPGLQSCESARYLRLQLNVTVQPGPDRILRMFEWEVLGRDECTRACQNGGICTGGICLCPQQFGWAGDYCDKPTCYYPVANAGGCGTNGNCVGPNQCECAEGFHTDDPTHPCAITRCGDGFSTSDEECDDGNVIDGDGCSTACTIENSTHA